MHESSAMKINLLLLSLLFISYSFAQKRSEMAVHFDYDKYDIRSADARKLDSLLATLPARKQDISIELYGHCDKRGTDTYNDALSLKRVKAVEDYLGNKGIEPAVLSKTAGYGEQRPIAEGHSETEHAMNRRVELIITIREEVIKEDVVIVPEKPVEKPVEQPTEKTLRSIQDSSVKAGDKIILKNLNFYGGMHRLLPESMPVLQELLDVMNNNPKLVIAIYGHVCCVMSDADGRDNETGLFNLSEARAKAVHDYLLKNGIARKRISYRGFGHQSPIYPYPENSEKERVLNRRVEVMIVSK
jgi:outer membrane protein OmpA-like peptidoglycan-associated protein